MTSEIPDDQQKEVEALEAHFDQLLLHSTRYESELEKEREENEGLRKKYAKVKRLNEELERNVSIQGYSPGFGLLRGELD